MNRKARQQAAGLRRHVGADAARRSTRRKLLIAFGAFTAPFASFVQPQGKVWRVGFLRPTDRSASAPSLEAFTAKMRELGYVEGKNLVIESRFADSNYERLPGLAAELTALKPDAIVVVSSPAIAALQKASTTIPIVMASTSDPVGNGFVKSLGHPGGNITGISTQSRELGPKCLEILRGMAPKFSRLAVLGNPDSPGSLRNLEDIRAAAQKTRVVLLRVDARNAQQIENALAAAAGWKAEGLLVLRDAALIAQARRIAELAVKHRLPSIGLVREFAEAGGLLSYGQNAAEGYRLAAAYVDKIFKGAKPGDLPVEQPTKFDLVINGKTAKALGLTIPQSLLISADRVIE